MSMAIMNDESKKTESIFMEKINRKKLFSPLGMLGSGKSFYDRMKKKKGGE